MKKAEAMNFENWYDTYERDGGELMLYNAIDLEAAYKAGYEAMREGSADIAEAHAHNGKECCRNKADTIKDAIRKLEVT